MNALTVMACCPQPPVLEARGPLQLLDALLLRHGLSVVALTTVVTPAFASAGGQAAASAYAAAATPMPVGLLNVGLS